MGNHILEDASSAEDAASRVNQHHHHHHGGHRHHHHHHHHARSCPRRPSPPAMDSLSSSEISLESESSHHNRTTPRIAAIIIAVIVFLAVISSLVVYYALDARRLMNSKGKQTEQLAIQTVAPREFGTIVAIMKPVSPRFPLRTSLEPQTTNVPGYPLQSPMEPVIIFEEPNKFDVNGPISTTPQTKPFTVMVTGFRDGKDPEGPEMHDSKFGTTNESAVKENQKLMNGNSSVETISSTPSEHVVPVLNMLQPQGTRRHQVETRIPPKQNRPQQHEKRLQDNWFEQHARSSSWPSDQYVPHIRRHISPINHNRNRNVIKNFSGRQVFIESVTNKEVPNKNWPDSDNIYDEDDIELDGVGLFGSFSQENELKIAAIQTQQNELLQRVLHDRGRLGSSKQTTSHGEFLVPKLTQVQPQLRGPGIHSVEFGSSWPQKYWTNHRKNQFDPNFAQQKPKINNFLYQSGNRRIENLPVQGFEKREDLLALIDRRPNRQIHRNPTASINKRFGIMLNAPLNQPHFQKLVSKSEEFSKSQYNNTLLTNAETNPNTTIISELKCTKI